jgi:predicted nucleotidyltransferase
MTQSFSQLEEPVLVALKALRQVFPTARMSIIGAGALAMHMDMTWRRTADVDVVLAIDIEELDLAESKLVGWKRGTPPRWTAPNGTKLDLVPAPADALAMRELIWPDGTVMSLAGIRVALEHRAHMASNELDIALAPVPLIAMLKMAAYLDRPHDRTKDLRDLAYVLYDYPPIDDDRLFDDEVFAGGLSQEQARGMILAREIAQLIGPEDREVVARFIAKMREDAPAWNRFVDESPWKYDEDRLREPFDAFCTTFAAST